jgi:hypothetical protein
LIESNTYSQAITAQNERDKMILGLLEAMNDVYSLAVKAEKLKIVKEHRETVRLMCRQTAECAWFISDYCSRNFGASLSMMRISGWF